MSRHTAVVFAGVLVIAFIVGAAKDGGVDVGSGIAAALMMGVIVLVLAGICEVFDRSTN